MPLVDRLTIAAVRTLTPPGLAITGTVAATAAAVLLPRAAAAAAGRLALCRVPSVSRGRRSPSRRAGRSFRRTGVPAARVCVLAHALGGETRQEGRSASEARN
eukprot:366335-Chlamydomonas_euryale.AAC.1